MELLVNDLSFEGQFTDTAAFKDAITRLMKIRETLRKFGRELHCHRNVAFSHITHDQIMQQAIQSIGQDQRRSVMQWLTRQGPFWEDMRAHSSDDYLECNGKVVTDTAMGEAAYHSMCGEDYRLVSLSPSSWEYSPLLITWEPDEEPSKNLEVMNYWDQVELETVLRDAPAPIHSWDQLDSVSRSRFVNLSFAENPFGRLHGHPFVNGAAQQLLILLDTLDRLKICFDETGGYTEEGQHIYQDHFTGQKCWFSDSSATEKNDFSKELTFRHPESESETLFCTWHGKVKTPQLRIHFSWPITAKDPLYIVYVGPKITKR